MRDYSKLSPFFWVRGSGKRMRGDAVAQVVAIYLSTCPAANMIGIFYVPVATIAHDTGHSVEDVQAALGRIEAAGYASYDLDEGLVWIPNHAWFEVGPTMSSGDKRRKKVIAELAQAGSHQFADAFLQKYGQEYGLASRAPTTSRGQEPGCPTEAAPVTSRSEDLPRSIPTPEGASGDREQDRTGQDRNRSGQGQGQGLARPGLVRLDIDLESDAQKVWEQRTFTKSAGKPIEDVWANFLGHFADHDFGSRGALVGRWSKWVDKQCDIHTKERQQDQDRKAAFARRQTGPGSMANDAPVSAAQEAAALAVLRDRMAKRKGAA